jgi:hypothetical protein
VRHCSGEGFGLADPARDLLLGREQAHEALLLINLAHLLGQVLGVALSEFHDRVDATCLEQLRILASDASNAKQIGVVDPREDLRVPDTTAFRPIPLPSANPSRPARVAPFSSSASTVGTPAACNLSA